MFPRLFLTRVKSRAEDARDEAEDDLLARFDPEELRDPRLHARNCEARTQLWVKTARTTREAIRDLHDKSDRNFLVVCCGLTLILLRGVVPTELYDKWLAMWLG